jgi:phage replication-related protein YjqB (UPF0714/DUF867 family)
VADKFTSYRELVSAYKRGVDFSVSSKHGSHQRFLVAAIHGGNIEPGTSAIAEKVAGNSHGLYLFEGNLKDGNYENLHITSQRFDEPEFVKQAEGHECIVTIHGCSDNEQGVCLGGLNEALKKELQRSLESAGVPSNIESHDFQGNSPDNVCNRGKDRSGVQIEIPRSFRDNIKIRERIIDVIQKQLSGSLTR